MKERSRALGLGALIQERLWGRELFGWRQRDAASTAVLLSPWVISFLVFSLYPILYSLYLSFTQYNPLTGQPPQWVGLANYARLLGDRRFLQALQNTLFFVVGTIPVTTTIALILAVILNQQLRLRAFFRASYFLPSVTSMIVISTIFVYIYAPYGPLNGLLALLGVERTNWLLSTRWALPAIMAMDIWASFGYYTILFLAGLQNIPEELHEAAEVDGASPLGRFFRVTLPLLRPTLVFVLVINTIRSFQIFSEIFVMTQGRPLGRTTTVVYYLYTMGFQRFDMGYASALAYVLFFIILLFSLIQYRLIQGEDVWG
ncbi:MULTISPECIES: carbohydrate ABC transporter permease [Limnochorda]|uniref:carbohydrate ABC transporter permease n=1 Tax=Limnochorda TaxID=1676651 RepID=UPI001D7C8972|nr:sugar ABC transporter permease [Limnochorda pilosa]MBO2487132.1 sugar ABC transporter permease [Bacillota bacterium]MBO2519933.1 sugar ABC transporter permease [Bacillota bacterium]